MASAECNYPGRTATVACDHRERTREVRAQRTRATMVTGEAKAQWTRATMASGEVKAEWTRVTTASGEVEA
jgi:hypothetical protein